MLIASSLQINDLLGLASTLNGLLGHLLPTNLLAAPSLNLGGLSSLGSLLNAIVTGLGLPGLTSALNGAVPQL